MKATSKNGDEWTGERADDWWLYEDSQGRVYESREVPAYRIQMDNAKQILVDGKLTIAPNL
jgi:hypothetical protein